MNSVFAYASFTLPDSGYPRKKYHVTDPVENVPSLKHSSTAIQHQHTFHGRNILYCSKHSVLNGDETPPGPYDDDNDDDED